MVRRVVLIFPLKKTVTHFFAQVGHVELLKISEESQKTKRCTPLPTAVACVLPYIVFVVYLLLGRGIVPRCALVIFVFHQEISFEGRKTRATTESHWPCFFCKVPRFRRSRHALLNPKTDFEKKSKPALSRMKNPMA